MQRTSSHPRSWRLLTCSFISAAALNGTARADDSEIFIPQSVTAPNIMLILDTSGSMSGQVTTQEAYDSTRNYVAEATGSCAGIGGRVYFKTGDNQGTPPACGSTAWVSDANMRCAAATTALASAAGAYQADRYTQWRRSTRDNANNDRTWRTLTDNENQHDQPVDCRGDNNTAPYADTNGRATNDTPVYTNNSAHSVWTDTNYGTSATLYSANYIAYYAQFRTARLGTRLEVMQQAATTLLNSVSNVNVGLMRYSVNTAGTASDPRGNGGGMVIGPVAPIATNRSDLISAINAFVPNGNTPLSETLYEAHQYFSGGSVYFGDTSQACLVGNSSGCTGSVVNVRSVGASRVGGVIAANTTYSSPATESCQNNYIVYLTDGEPTSDSKANTLIRGLPDFATLVPSGCAASGQGACLGALTEYMFDKDLRGSLAGNQNVTTFYIGFGDAFGGGTSNAAFQYLEAAAARGGGDAYQAGDLSELTRVFNDIFNQITRTNATMTAPTVAVNAFNRTRTLDDLYIAVFQPTSERHWPGNVKKYQVGGATNSTILARGDTPAVNPNGTFIATTSDYWSQTNSDGAEVVVGGAARRIPAPTSRNLYTYIGNNQPRVAAGAALSAVNVANTAITDAVLGTNATDNPARDKLINWARGADVDDEDEDNDEAEARFAMGDPMHSQPAVVIYGGTTAAQNADDAVVFTATNDGYLHAFDVTTGAELWAMIPREMLPGLKALYQNENTATKNYSIDGDLRVLKYDINGDGIVTPAQNDRVMLFFSTGRNPTVSRYYALDVTSKNTPKFLWSIGADELEGLGQAWSRPVFTRVNVNGATQNSQKLVLVFGGGYDPVEEGGAFIRDTDVGNRLFMVDALYGTLLWSAGDTGKDLNLPRMTHSIPAPVNVVDLDGDGFADRMYVGDMAAQLWRFDIFNGRARNALVTGGVMASLGARDEATVRPANTRRFYNSPDAALLRSSNNSPPFINIAIGSGYRGHPLQTANEDRFYAIRDYRPFTKLAQTEYENLPVVTDAQLDDITTNLAPTLGSNSKGWKLQLNDPSYRGEKVLSSATTLENVIFFTSYTPNTRPASNACSVASGSNLAYAISAFDGRPLPRRETPTTPPGPNDPPGPEPDPPTRDDRNEDLGQTGIASEVTMLFPEKDKVTCLAGVEVLDVCRDWNSRIKTYWRQKNAN